MSATTLTDQSQQQEQPRGLEWLRQKGVKLYETEKTDLAINEAIIRTMPSFHLEQENRSQPLTDIFAMHFKVDSERVLKTLVVDVHSADRRPIVVIMQGNKRIDMKLLAKSLSLPSVCCLADGVLAHSHSGYEFGGTSPFGVFFFLKLVHFWFFFC
eukprot:TRINITY_DN1999_c0_g1_i3.p1 TRINITY_DN1999_c0_g1~~TRINITY_DN1999_c0_g1_i3.p1  ORF type:complete len:156 (-),score=23.11 TRINITY_DN1999_c0_g1_i3:319-786(-)